MRKNKAQQLHDDFIDYINENENDLLSKNTLLALNEIYCKENTVISFYYSKYINILYQVSCLDLVNVTVIELLTFYKKTDDKTEFYLLLRYLFKLDCNVDMKTNYRKLDFFLVNNFSNHDFLQKIIKYNYTLDNIIYTHSLDGKEYILTPYANTFLNNQISNFFGDYIVQRRRHFAQYALYLSNTFFNVSFEIINNIDDKYIDDMLSKNIKVSRQHFLYLRDFILYLCSQKKLDNIKLYTEQVISYTYFTKYFKEGFRPVLYNKFDKVPMLDKWLLIPNGEEIRSTKLSCVPYIKFDFSKLINKKLRDYAKKYYWADNSGLITKQQNCKKLIAFCNLLSETEDELIKEIDLIKTLNYKTYIMSKYKKFQTYSIHIYVIKNFLAFLNSNSEIYIDDTVFSFMTCLNKDIKSTSNTKVISYEDLNKIVNNYEKYKYDSIKSLMFNIVLHISLNTEFRVSQILSLNTDCISESVSKGRFVIRSTTKVSKGFVLEQQCPILVKRMIDEYLSKTSNFRNTITNENYKKKLFIIKDEKVNRLRVPNSNDIRMNLKKHCHELGLELYNSKDLRKTFITRAKIKSKQENKSDALMLRVSGHKSMTTVYNHYYEIKVREALEATYKVIIGDINVEGILVDNKSLINTSKELTVLNECGYCLANDCISNGMVQCLTCRYFAVTTDRIPFFKKLIDKYDTLIVNSEHNHDKEDLLKFKKLCVKYLEKLRLKSGGIEYDNSRK